MSDEIARTMTDRVTEKLKAEFVSLISDEEWSAMVKTSYKNFFKKKEDHSGPFGQRGYNNEAPSEFESIIQAETNRILKEKVKDSLQELCNNEWEDGKLITTSLLGKMIDNSESLIFKSMMDGMADYMNMTVQQSLMNRIDQ